MTISKFVLNDIKALDKVFRLNLINSITGYKPANLIGTISEQGTTNLAIFSSAIHLGSDPALIGCIMRPHTVPRHTYENILATGSYTMNHVHESYTKQAHDTSAKFDRNESEFRGTGLNEEYLDDFPAPFVAESPIKVALTLVEEIPIKINQTNLLIGENPGYLFTPNCVG